MDWRIICYAIGVIGISAWAIDKMVRKIIKNRKRNIYAMTMAQKTSDKENANTTI